jgi:hypothetical protein
VNFIEGERRAFLESQQRDTDLYIEKQREAGLMSRQAANDLRATHDRNMEAAIEQSRQESAVNIENARLQAGADISQAELDSRRLIAAAGYTNAMDIAELKIAADAGRSEAEFIADRNNTREKIQAQLTIARERNRGGMPNPAQVATQRAKLISDRVAAWEKENIGQTIDPAHRALIAHNIFRDWNRVYFLLSNPGVTNVQESARPGGEPGFDGILPNGQRVAFP